MRLSIARRRRRHDDWIGIQEREHQAPFISRCGEEKTGQTEQTEPAPSVSFSSDEPKRQSFDLTVSGIQFFMAVFVS
jgi:hypothetical protein